MVVPFQLLLLGTQPHHTPDSMLVDRQIWNLPMLIYMSFKRRNLLPCNMRIIIFSLLHRHRPQRCRVQYHLLGLDHHQVPHFHHLHIKRSNYLSLQGCLEQPRRPRWPQADHFTDQYLQILIITTSTLLSIIL